MAELSDLASLRRAFFRAVDADPDDPALTEHEDSPNEVVDQHLLEGVREAQDWLLSCGDIGTRWIKQVSLPTESDWQGTERNDGGRWTALPDDFHRLWGDEGESGLRKPNGTQWGRLIDPEMRFDVSGDRYWLEGDELWIAHGANPPNDLEMDYLYRVELPSGSSTVDLPSGYRRLAVAYAASEALGESWCYADPSKISRHLENWKQKTRRRSRPSRQPRQMRQKQTAGSHWIFP